MAQMVLHPETDADCTYGHHPNAEDIMPRCERPSMLATTAIELMNAVRILVVDDHPIVREGIVRLLSAESDLEVVGEIGAYEDAIAAVPSLRPDLAIVD